MNAVSSQWSVLGERASCFVLCALLLALSSPAEAQQAKKIPRIGLVHLGGSYYPIIAGLRSGLRELGLEEGKQFVFENRDAKGDPKVAEASARDLERERVSLIYALSARVAKLAEQATVNVPIVFCVASDPVTYGLVQSFARPGDRLTGIHYLGTDLTAKRLEILKEIMPRLRSVITYCDTCDGVTAAAPLGREAAGQLGIKFVERHVASSRELQEALEALKAGDADAYFYTTNAIVAGQAQLVVNKANNLRLPTMFHEETLVANGALASYGVDFHEVGRLSARYIPRILAGTKPKDLAVESYHRLSLVINLKTGKQIGVTIPPNVLARADRVIK
jgi:putative tryptophan/tyrosine transport system substrate-binding protein